MAIKAIWPIRHNGEEYPPGKLLTGLDKDEEKHLVEKGLATYEGIEDDDLQADDAQDNDDAKEYDQQEGDQSETTEPDEKTATNRGGKSRRRGK